MKKEVVLNPKAEAERIYKLLAKKQPSVEEVKQIMYLVNQMARKNARIGS